MPASMSRRRLLAAAALGALAFAAPASAEVGVLTLIAPANPGGDWDQTARIMQTVLQNEELASRVQVKNIPGAGGIIGLAQFVTSEAGKGDTVLFAGQTLQGAIITNKSAVNLGEVPTSPRTGSSWKAS